MAYNKQTWDTTSYVNPTRMNHMEDGIENANSAADTLGEDVERIKSDIGGLNGSNTIFVGDFEVPHEVYTEAKFQIIENLKAFIPHIPYAFRPVSGLISNYGRAIIWGYTYEPNTDNPSFAQFYYTPITNNKIYSCRCYEHEWTITMINGTELN